MTNCPDPALFPEPPAKPEPEQTSAKGSWGGPTYGYRGARIECYPGGHVCGLLCEDHPLHGQTFGVVGTITPLIDLWLDGKRLPKHIRVVGKRAEGA